MNDLYHWYGNDINIASNGDLLPVSSTARGQQRVLRRLLTNPGDYIWHPTYGAGLGQFVGATTDIQKVRAVIRAQILLEDSVAKTPDPVITVNPIANGLNVRIQYNDAQTQSPQVLSFSVSQ